MGWGTLRVKAGGGGTCWWLTVLKHRSGMTGYRHEAQVWEMQLLARVFSSQQALPSLTPSTFSGQWSEDTSCRVCQMQRDWGKTRSSFYSSPCYSGVVGSRRLETTHTASHLVPGSTLHSRPTPCPVSLRGGIAPQWSAYSLSTLSLLFHGQLMPWVWGFVFTSYSDSPWLPTFTTMISFGNLDQSFAQKLNNILMRKGHELQMAWSNLPLKPLENCQGRLCS